MKMSVASVQVGARKRTLPPASGAGATRRHLWVAAAQWQPWVVAARRLAIALMGSMVLAVGTAGVASAEQMFGRGYFWTDERVVQHVPMDDPWIFRGPAVYEVITQPTCWIYADRDDLVAEVWVNENQRFEPLFGEPDRLFFPVHETLTVNWVNTTTGERGQTVAYGDSGNVIAGVAGGQGRIEMDIHLRSNHPWLTLTGSTDLPFGYSTGTIHATVDLAGKSCGY